MRKFLLFLFLILSKISFSQVNDHFTDGDFTQNPIWTADLSTNFIILNQQLRSNATTANTNFYLSTPNTKALNCTWEFDINLQFSTSGANFVDVYLISNVADLKSANINGYFLRMGNTADEVALYRRSGATSTSVKIIDGIDGAVGTSNNNFKFRITRNSAGVFNLERDDTGTGNSFLSEGTATDNTFTTTAFFGFLVQQSTTTFHQKHFFDNVLIQDIILDTTPPILNTLVVNSGTQILLNFNEAVNAADAKIVNRYVVNPGNIQPASVVVNGANVILTFANEFNTGTFTLTVNTIKDLAGNTITAPINRNFNYRRPYTAKLNDIVINEIFADPSPQIDLPTVEFVELWNRSAEDISLVGFKYSDATTTYTFGLDSIKANQYVILCARADTAEYKRFGKVIGLSPWPSLNNASDQLKLLNQNGTLIYNINYSDTFYKDAVKRNGGYTLELIDPLSICKPSQNFSASNDVSGGTPGRQNSIYLSNRISTSLQLLSAVLKDSLTVSLTFNRGLDSLQATLPNQYIINNGVGIPQLATPLAPNFATVEIKYNQALNRNQTYTITVNGLTDCGGNTLTTQTRSFVYPGLINKNDVLINEILFNPRSGGVDFVEVYNNSNKILDFKDLTIAAVNDRDSVISPKAVSTATLLFQPQTYWVIASNPDTVKSQYQTQNPNNFIKITSLPSYNDESGKAVILNKDNARVDQLNYNSNMHFALLRDVNGVSLERSSFEKPTNEKRNFRSAAASVGYATPTYQNSQFLESVTSAEEISLASETFSPDNDGFEDVLRILYNFSQTDRAANVTIYNDQGRLIKKLIRNETTAAKGEWIWDGLDDNNAKVKTGIYIIYIELFDLSGNVKKYKKTAVAASRFD
jgi:hypothetical protein